VVVRTDEGAYLITSPGSCSNCDGRDYDYGSHNLVKAEIEGVKVDNGVVPQIDEFEKFKVIEF
jgi:hypothetical protein